MDTRSATSGIDSIAAGGDIAAGAGCCRRVTCRAAANAVV